jgi:hypothetical protein
MHRAKRGLPRVRGLEVQSRSARSASVLRKLGRTRTDGLNLQGAGAGSAASLPCCWQKQDCSECSHSECSQCSSVCEPFQRARCKPVERIDCVGKSATAVACDHRRLRRNSICQGVSRSRGLRQKRKSKGDDRGRGPRVMGDKKSICLYTCLHVTPASMYNPSYVAHGLQICLGKENLRSPRGISDHRVSI